MRLRRGWAGGLVVGALLLAGARPAFAGGPRYVTGPPFFTGTAGVAIGWKQTNLLYSTDPGGLSAAVNHAAADAIVAAAAGVWNVPVARISVAQGGLLTEHVSGQNTYLSSTGMVWPADVMSTNAAAIPVAVVYDTDGSVTETLLGAGASDPIACEQTGVTETVDSFSPAGYILHAIIVLNGRCTGSDPQMQMQMQYQLERVFGRVLGLAWSQTNDNVFTGVPEATRDQALHWPIMHPIDILCGPYSYQCLPNPFTLRPDDVAGLVAVYGIPQNSTIPPGKAASLAAANAITGTVSFPNGEGMAGVNVVVTREPRFSSIPQGWIEASAVSGSSFQRAGWSPFVAGKTTAAASFGTLAAANQGLYTVAYFQILDPTNEQTELIGTEAVNPLYILSASVGPYAPGAVTPAGSPPAALQDPGIPAAHTIVANLPIADAPATCGGGTDGTAAAPMAEPPSGWWNGTLCGYGHAAYTAVNVRQGRSLTVEVTALDANGFATTGKVMPVIGLFAPTDGAGSLPSLAVAPAAFQAVGLGMTTLNASIPVAVGAGSGAGSGYGTVRVGIADQRGDGRPDFAYQARVFYADSIAPAAVPVAGGAVTITGTGFRPGNPVLVNGVEATVTSWTANTIVLTVPSMAAAGAVGGTPVDVEVDDLGTGASSVMTGALTYGVTAAQNHTMQLVSAPATAVLVGTTANLPFAVQVLMSDGVTPVAGETVVFSTTTGAARYGACGTSICSVLTDANGMASTPVTPAAAGLVTMQAADGSGTTMVTLSASFPAVAQASSMKLVSAPSGNVLDGQAAATVFSVQVLAADGKTGMAGQTVVFSVTAGAATFGGCNLAVCNVVTNTAGVAQATVTPGSLGTVTVAATDGALQQTASVNGTANNDVLTVLQVPSASAYVNQSAGVFAVRLFRSDGVTVVANAPIQFTAPAGVVFGPSGNNAATMNTETEGSATVAVAAAASGTYTIQAAYGTLQVTATFTASVFTNTINILSAPSGTLPVGVMATTPFTAQLLSPSGKPVAGATVVIGAVQGQVLMGCGVGNCQLITDANGKVSSTVTPLLPGLVTLMAAWLNVSAATSFTATGGVETLKVLAAPPATVPVGTPVSFSVEALSPDGVTPEPGRTLVLTVASGSFAVKGCAYGNCKYSLGASGTLTVTGTGYVPGAVSLLATVDGLTQTANFTVTPNAYTMKVVSSPPALEVLGTAVATPFEVEILNADGVTPVSGENITFSLASGSAGIAGCAALPCVMKTGSNGLASSGVITPTAPGTVTITATDNGMSQSASFTAANPDVMSVVNEPANGSLVGSAATVPFAVQVMSANGSAPEPGRSVLLQVLGGTLGVCGGVSCTVTTDANGMAASPVTPEIAGTIVLTATEQGAGETAKVTESFVSAPPPDQMTLVSAPANGSFAGSAAAVAFAVKVTGANGMTAQAGRSVLLAVNGGTLGVCGAASCVVTTDANGLASSTVTPTAVGTVGLTATEQGTGQTAVVTGSFTATAPADTMALVSAPANGSSVGSAAAVPFAVKVMSADGTVAESGKSVLLSAAGATLGGCGTSSCVLTTSANGIVSSMVTPTAVGTVALTATEQGAGETATVTASFTASALPDLLSVATAPAKVYFGATTSTPFSVRVTLADGLTPVAGLTVVLASMGGPGAAQFTACGAAVCNLLTDANGTMSSLVTGTQVGAVTLSATAEMPTGNNAITSGFQVIANVPQVTAVDGQIYVAETAIASLPLDAQAQWNGNAAAGQTLTWTGGTGFLVSAGTTVTDASGDASVMGTAGPLSAGSRALVTVCGWTTACAQFQANGVAFSALQIAIASGDSQAISGGAALVPVVAQVTDNGGHVVVGAPVTVGQTARALDAACPPEGRCPSGAVLASSNTVMVSDGKGNVSAAPLVVPGVATSTALAFSVGTQGFATTVVSSTP